MTFKKGDKIQTEDGETGEVLFVDKGGDEAQVALKRVSMKIRTETLRIFKPQETLAPALELSKAPASGAKKSKPRPAAKRSSPTRQ